MLPQTKPVFMVECVPPGIHWPRSIGLWLPQIRWRAGHQCREHGGVDRSVACGADGSCPRAPSLASRS